MNEKPKRKNIAFPERVHQAIKLSAVKKGQKVTERAVELVEAGQKAEGGGK